MRVYLRDYLSQTEDRKKITNAFHFFNQKDPRTGYLIGLISIGYEGDFDTSNLLRFIWNGIVDEFSSSETNSIERLRKTIGSGALKLSELLKNSPVEDSGVDLNISLVHFVDDLVYFGFFGSSGISIFHEDELVSVSELLKKSSVNVGSTQLNEEDVVFMTSEEFWTENNIKVVDVKTLNTLLEKVEKTEIKLGSGVVMASTGVDFEEEMLKMGPEIIDVSTTMLPKVLDFDSSDELPEDSQFEEKEEFNSVDEAEEEPIEDQLKIDQESGSDDLQYETEEEIAKENEVQLDVDEDVANEDIVQKNIEEEPEISTQEYEDSPFEEVVISGGDYKNQRNGPDNVDQHEERQDKDMMSETQDVQKDEGPSEKKGILDKTTAVFAVAYLSFKRALPGSKKGGVQKDLTLKERTSSFHSWIDRHLFNRYGRSAWMKKTKAKISQQGISSPSLDGLKIGGYRQKSLRKKRFMILGAFVLILIAGFIGVTKASQIRKNMKLHQEFQAFYDDADQILEDAEKNVTTDADSTESSLFEAQEMIVGSKYQEEDLNEEDEEKFNELEARVLGVSDSLYKVDEVREDEGFSLFFDTKVNLDSKSDPTDIATYKDERTLEHLIIADKGNKAVYRVSLYDKSIEKVQDPNKLIKEPLFVDVGVDGIYVYDNVQGVLMIPFKKNKSELDPVKALTGVKKTDFNIDSPEEFAVLTQSDNFYLVDSQTKSIYKSNRTTAGSYSFPTKYYTDDTISGATDFFADFSTYVSTTEPPYFNRYLFDYINTGLVSSPLEMRGLRGDIGAITAGYTGGTLDNKLYLFDSSTNRIMVFEKPNENSNRHPGQLLLITQYAYRGDKKDVFENVKDFVTDFDERNIYILDSTRIWRIETE